MAGHKKREKMKRKVRAGAGERRERVAGTEKELIGREAWGGITVERAGRRRV